MPSPAVLADEGVKAVAAGKYAEGIEKLSEALKERPAPLWLLERSKAYLRTNELDLALHDAEKALQVAFQRANRDHMIEAQLRRAITLFRMGRYADADICAFWTLRLLDKAKATEDDGQPKKVDENGEYTVRSDEVKHSNGQSKDQQVAAAMNNSGRSKDSTLRNQAVSWRLQALSKLESLPTGHPGRKVTISEKYPNPPELAPASNKVGEKGVISTHADSDDNDDDSQTAAASSGSKSLPAKGESRDTWETLWKQFCDVFTSNSVRSSFYQTDTTINADFFVKNVPADRFAVTTESQKVVMGPIPNANPGSIQLHLWGRVKPDETKHTVKSMKVELVLKKETPGKWPALQREDAEGFANIAGSSTKTPPSFERFSALVSRLGYNTPQDLGLPEFSRDQKAWYGALLEKLGTALDGSEAPSASASAPNKSSEAPIVTPEATSSSSTGENATVRPKGNLAQASNNPTAKPTPSSTKVDSAEKVGSTPAYPTSSKKGAVNWDKITVDDDDDDKDGSVDTFFQKLYKDADDDTKRAMMKSYIESNGTSLSTSWAEAKDKTYKTQPPDGAEAKKWDE